MGERKIRQVSFNMEDAGERELYEYAEQFTFSTYVKRLIFRDFSANYWAHKAAQLEGTQKSPRNMNAGWKELND